MSKQVFESRDGFKVKRDKYEYPPNLTELSEQGKRAAAICDLFVNSGFSIHRIAVMLLGEDVASIVKTLIAHHIVGERRVSFGKSPTGKERRSGAPGWIQKES